MGLEPVNAKFEEMISCRGTALGFEVRGVNGSIGYNKAMLDNWSRGNLHNFPLVSSKEARLFNAAVTTAHNEQFEAGTFTGRRSAFHCAEVNAVVLLLAKGARISDIRLYRATGDRRQVVNYCPACDKWIKAFDLNKKLSIQPRNS